MGIRLASSTPTDVASVSAIKVARATEKLPTSVAATILLAAAVLLGACSDSAPPFSADSPLGIGARHNTSGGSGLLPAFPGAEGWGAIALNECRSKPIQVLTVTNTNSEGPGSFTQAVRDIERNRFSFVIFRTGGRILAPGDLNIRLRKGCAYIAGQTATGDGIVIEGDGTAFWFRGYGPNSTDVVMRYLRFRGTHGRTQNHLIIARGERIVLDHMSFSWADNYLLALLRYGGSSWSAPIANVSIQNSILSEAFEVHPTGAQISSNEEFRHTGTIDLTNVSFHRNLFAHNSHRNPNSGADNALFANNVIYNWNQGTHEMTMRGVADFVNNVGRAGPMTSSRFRYMINPHCGSNSIDGFDIYAAGNIGPMSEDPNGDNWTGSTRQVACYYKSGGAPGQEVPREWRRDMPQGWASAPFPVRVVSAQTAYGDVLHDVGANARLSCDGDWEPALDPVDTRIISDAADGTGPSKPPAEESSVGGWSSYAHGTPCNDTDDDGLPDAWEERFYTCATCADPAAVGRAGYLVIEHYLNGTTPL